MSEKVSKMDQIEGHMKKIMNTLGCDMNDESLKDTPKRVAKMFVNEIFSGMDEKNEPRITTFPNDYGYDQIVGLADITVYSTCEHHFLPFPMKVHIGYIPNETVIGLSKLARIAKYIARRPQVQERFTRQVVDFIIEKIKPKGVIVIAEGQHMCMQMRGIENHTATMITSETRGIFRNEKEMEQKFLEFVKVSRGG